MVHLSTSYKITTNLFFFLFGFPEGYKPIEEEVKQEAEYEYIDPEEYKHENVADMFEFMKNDDVMMQDGDNDLFKLDDEFDIPIDTEEGENEHIEYKQTPMIRIGNQMVSGPKHTPAPVEQRGRNKGPKNRSTNKEKRSARSVSVFKVKDTKVELDLLSSILEQVENATKQVQEDIEKNEEADYECKIEVSKHLASEMSRTILMSIISDEEYMSTVGLKLIEVFLKKNNELIIDNLVYKCIRYLSEDHDEEYNICEYFNSEVKESLEQSKNSEGECCVGLIL
jgi:hypothetical protein